MNETHTNNLLLDAEKNAVQGCRALNMHRDTFRALIAEAVKSPDARLGMAKSDMSIPPGSVGLLHGVAIFQSEHLPPGGVYSETGKLLFRVEVP